MSSSGGVADCTHISPSPIVAAKEWKGSVESVFGWSVLGDRRNVATNEISTNV